VTSFSSFKNFPVRLVSRAAGWKRWELFSSEETLVIKRAAIEGTCSADFDTSDVGAPQLVQQNVAPLPRELPRIVR
jgi:hypothetical protein